jgi:hypothetical protein
MKRGKVSKSNTLSANGGGLSRKVLLIIAIKKLLKYAGKAVQLTVLFYGFLHCLLAHHH